MNGTLLVAAAERWGTPLYVMDLDVAARNLATWQAALPGALVAYAVKANPDPALLRRLVADGAGCEVAGPIELALARRAGCPPERIVVNGVGLTDADLADALATGARVNAESLGALDALLAAADRLDAPARIGLRINPGLDAATHPHLATGAADAKFGIGLDDLPAALDRMVAAGLPLASLGAHIGSDIADTTPYEALAAVLARAAADATERGLPPQRIDIGGGTRRAGELHPPTDLPLIVEPGRSIVAGAGWLLTRVVRVQPRNGLVHLVADAGMTELLRPMLYGAEHPVSLLAAGAALDVAGTVALSGPVCEAGDVLVRDLARYLPADELRRAGEGALLAIGEAGAYGAAMASNYNGRLRPAQVVVERGELRLSRRRETLDDLVARDVDA